MSRGSLERATKKKQPFDVPEQAVALNVLRTNELLQHRFGRLYREHGLTQAQYNILRILRGAKEPLPSLEIADRMITVVPGITGLVDRLEGRSLVTRRQSDADRRVWLVAITRKGRDLLARLDEPTVALYRELCGHLTRTECRQAITLLEKIRERIDVP